MCMGLASGYIEQEKLSLLKKDPTETFKETVCDKICRFPRETVSEDQLDDLCSCCIVDKVKKVELEV